MLIIVLPILLLLNMSCSTTEPLKEGQRSTDEGRSPYIEISDEEIEEFVMDDLDEDERTLYLNRSRLTDEFANIDHDLPEIFTREITIDENAVDRFAGFRVQLISTRDVVEADEVKDNFIAWADSTIEGYEPNAYVHFRQPYYRVRAGDFQDRQKAIEFSRLIKQHYPDSWIVHDRIEPQYAPADTTTFRFKELEQIDEDQL